MDRLHSIDLHFLGLEKEIGVYLFDTAIHAAVREITSGSRAPA